MNMSWYNLKHNISKILCKLGIHQPATYWCSNHIDTERKCIICMKTLESKNK
jgi:hypothetical protein